MRLLLLLLLYILVVPPIPAQVPSYAHYGVQDGLPGNLIYCATQDYRGFLWFGTDKGLVRFDGLHFQVFGVKDGLPDPEVLNLFEDSYHRLWISCFSQRPCYMENGRFVTAENDSLLAKINLKSSLIEFSEDRAGNVWIAGNDEVVFSFNGKTIERKKFPFEVNRINQIGNLLFGVGTAHLMKDFNVLCEFSPKLNDGKRLQYISSAVINDQLLIALRTKLLLLKWIDNHFIESDTFLLVGGRTLADHSGRFWVPSSKGVTCFDNNKHDLSNPTTYLPTQKVNAVFEDRHGTMWFCTGGDGIYALSSGKAVTYNQVSGLENDNISALSYDLTGHLLSGDNGGNVYKVTNSGVQKTNVGPANTDNRVRQIVGMADQSLWIATDLGLFHHNRRLTRKTQITGLKAILAKHDTVWFGTHSDLSYFKGYLQKPLPFVKCRTTTLCNDTENNIWGGRISGLYSQRDSFQFNWGDRFPILKKHIIALQSAGPGHIWAVTPESGLLLVAVKAGAVTNVQIINQYLANPIENIVSLSCEWSPTARIWLATNSGVYGINPSDWSVIHYDHEDGLADDDVNCVLVARDTLWAGTVAGLSCLRLLPSGDRTNFNSFITELRYQLDNKLLTFNLLDSLQTSHQILLPANATMATLNLAGLDYRNQGSIRYQCITTKMLPPMRWWTRQNLYNWISHGFQNHSDTTFIETNTLNFGIAPPSGSYRIKITAVMRDFYSKYPDQWTVIIRPQWYSTVWIDLIIWIAIALIFGYILRTRARYQKLSTAVSELQLQALQSQINPHFVGNSINSIQQFFYPPDPMAASNYIELFTRLLRATIFLSEKHFNGFQEELSYDTDYLKMIKFRFGDRFHYKIIGADTIPINMPFPSMLLQPLLENATIHGLSPLGDSILLLQFSLINGKFECIITDNGIGVKATANAATKKKDHRSKGLDLLYKKVKIFNDLYALGMELHLSDRSEANPDEHGTRILIVFYPDQIKKQSRMRRDS